MRSRWTVLSYGFLCLLIVGAAYSCERRVKILLRLEPLRRVTRWVRRTGQGHTVIPSCFFAHTRPDPARKRLPRDETGPTPVLSDGELSAFADGRDRERQHIVAIRMQ